MTASGPAPRPPAGSRRSEGSAPERGSVKRVLVTGGCGFIGSNFIRHLLAADAEVGVDVRGRREIFQLVKPPFVDTSVRES